MTISRHSAPAKKRKPAFLGLSGSAILIMAPCLVVILLATEGIRDEGAISLQGDMPRYLMNGVYFLDLIRDFPITDPMTYTYHYFAKYPALSLGHHPLLLSAAEVPFFAIFGVSVFSGRLTVICFTLLAGIAWFLLVKSIYDEHVAFFSSLLLVTTPFFVQFSRIVLSEIPAMAFIILAAYFLDRYCRSRLDRHFYAFIAALLVSIFARYQAILMAPIFFGYILILKRPRNLITKKNLLICFFCMLLIAPLVLLALKYSPTNIHWLTRINLSSRLSFSNISYHITAVWKSHLTLPVLILSVLSMGGSIYRRDKRALLFLLWIVGYYLQITLIGATISPRYSMYWIPAFCLFAALPIDLFSHRQWKVLCSAVLILLSGWQFAMALQSEPDYASGYEQAAKFVLEHPKGESVLYSANVDTGYFIFFVRKHDPGREMIVLRSDKLFATSRLDRIVEERITRREQIYDALRDFGAGYVVLEDRKFESPPLEWLREEVKSERFILRRRIPIRSNSGRLKDVALAIYEYTGYTPPEPGKILHMNIPLMDGSIEINFDDLRSRADKPAAP